MEESVACQAIEFDDIIQEEDIECRPEKIPASALDENVDICSIRKYFSYDAWLLVEDIIKQKKEKMIWLCAVCQKDLNSDESIAYDSCLLWHHFTCVSVKKQPKAKAWFCRKCHLSAANACNN